MDISGSVRGVLRRFAATPVMMEQETDPLRLLVRAVGHPEEELRGVPAFLGVTAPLLVKSAGSGGQGRPVHGWLALSGALRMLKRVHRADRWRWEEGLQRQAALVVEGAKMMMALRTSPPVSVLWHYYLLMLARERIKVQVPEVLLKGLWQKAFAGQGRAGNLHPLTGETVVETFTYDELCALHAGFNAVVMPGGEEWMEPIERAVKWHVENTQPDHGTQEPWGLAAFAALDETGTFAMQQIHDATTRVERGGETGAILALLADAVLTQEEGAG